MSVIYGSLNVDEKYSGILEPNLFYDSVFVPGQTYTDQYEEGPAGGIYVHKLTSSAVTVGTPGRDFTDEASADTLLNVVLNNNYQKSKKIYGVQAEAVGFDLANEQLALATSEVKESWNGSGLACLVNEGTTSSTKTAITNYTDALIDERKEIVSAKGKADVVLCSPTFFAGLLKEAGDKFTPVRNDEVAATGAMGTYMGMTIIECNSLAQTSGKYYNNAGTLKTVAFGTVDFVMYNHMALSIVNNLEAMRIVDSENFTGSKAQVEMNSGFLVTSAAQVRVRTTTAA